MTTGKSAIHGKYAKSDPPYLIASMWNMTIPFSIPCGNETDWQANGGKLSPLPVSHMRGVGREAVAIVIRGDGV